MRRLLSQVVAAALGLWLATLFVKGVVITTYPTSNFFGIPLTMQWEMFLVLGLVLGLLNYFLKPLLKTLALPLEILTLGLFTIAINMGLIYLIDIMFDELTVPIFLPLLYTTLIIWFLNIITNTFLAKQK
jgi:putative membrane protein